jgi:hypothetical protein
MSQQEKRIAELDAAIYDVVPDEEQSTAAAKLVWNLGWRPEGWPRRRTGRPTPESATRPRLDSMLEWLEREKGPVILRSDELEWVLELPERNLSWRDCTLSTVVEIAYSHPEWS